ncbi:hypothetical protein HPB48_002286 [Haemaphysalis longicornis]|uniref:PIPK domain-containing protein n=1 Tax=Haemaphysalis longicornis TaxID=44386 RepID=A0A9J6FK49_HAELO|nr:hypothetical protein HPB48_002286 [Haemaphysalis longicornis]
MWSSWTKNLLKTTCDSPLYVRPHSKTVLSLAIRNDANFLSDNSVMDYSLLVGFDNDRKELVVGIIDYIRTFTWDKKLEMVVEVDSDPEGPREAAHNRLAQPVQSSLLRGYGQVLSVRAGPLEWPWQRRRLLMRSCDQLKCCDELWCCCDKTFTELHFVGCPQLASIETSAP